MAQFIALARRNYAAFPEPQFTPELMEAEAERARALYTAGPVRQIWSRDDVPGAVLLLEAGTIDDVRAALQTLPLVANGMLLLDAIVPLRPYRGFSPRG